MMMTLTQSVRLKSMVVQCAHGERFLLGQPTSTTLTLSRTPIFWSVLHSSPARNLGSTIAAASSSSRRKKKVNIFAFFNSFLGNFLYALLFG
ncbi:hypothetical protein L6164_024300 [Bauhinia variegata]|uniref:Uncharacterized protein n=1 Tax=Bauhinia variegata TaxID=167791 RepID=A0ACB9LXE6_BAUVA|nr:hypothetical protein L6164_024300 [Bauhinia variegata]